MERPETPFVDAYIGLGANVGDRLAALQRAVQAMADWPETDIAATSPIYETEAHVLPGADRQPDHLNAVVQLRTSLSPLELLARLHDAERVAGRNFDAPPWSPRPLDLDLLVYGSVRLTTDELAVPHPRLAERRFVLRPLADLAPSLVLPGTQASVAALLGRTPDTGRIERTTLSLQPTDVSDG